MKFDVTKPESVSSGSLESVAIKLGDTDVIFDLLRKQYTFPIQTPVQEMLCNARDSHRRAKQSKKMEVKLPSATYPFMSVRDFGMSMSPEDFSNVWAGMGNSTSRLSDELTGGFGIGSKAWFAYRDNWFIKIFYGGQVKTYEITNAKVYSGSAELRDVSDSDEPQGIEVIVPTKEGDTARFERAFYRATYFWTDLEKPLITNRHEEEISEIWKNTPETLSLNDNVVLYPTKCLTSFSENFDKVKDFFLVLDGIPYIVPAPLLNKYIRHDAYQTRYGSGYSSSQEYIADGAKPYQPLCDMLRTVYKNSEAKVAVFNVKIGEIKLVNHRESIDYSEENIQKVIKFIHKNKIELDKGILNACKELLQKNHYSEAFKLCLKWQKHWLITQSDTSQYEKFFPYPFKFKNIEFNGSYSWSWLSTDESLTRTNAILSYHKVEGKVYQFEMNKQIKLNPTRSSVFVIKDDTVKTEIMIKKKLNILGLKDLYIVDLALLPPEIRDGFKDISGGLTFGEWWIKTGLLDSELRKPTKKDSSIISLHYLSHGKRDSVSKKFADFSLEPRFANTIFVKMKQNKPDTKIVCINPLIDFMKVFFRKNVAMTTEENYETLKELMDDQFIDFHEFLDELVNPSEETYQKMVNLTIKSFFHKIYSSSEYHFTTIKYNSLAKSHYIQELTVYLMSNDKNLKITNKVIKNLTNFGLNISEMSDILYSFSKPEEQNRKSYMTESENFNLISHDELLRLFPKFKEILNILEVSYSQIEKEICQTIPFLQFVRSNDRSNSYGSAREKGVEYEIHPIVIENLKQLEKK